MTTEQASSEYAYLLAYELGSWDDTGLVVKNIARTFDHPITSSDLEELKGELQAKYPPRCTVLWVNAYLFESGDPRIVNGKPEKRVYMLSGFTQLPGGHATASYIQTFVAPLKQDQVDWFKNDVGLDAVTGIVALEPLLPGPDSESPLDPAP